MKNNTLHSIKKSGFKTPSHYFNNLEDAIIPEIKLKHIASNSGFKTPDNYFETFDVSVKKDTKVISIFSKKSKLLVSSIAATLILFFGLKNMSSNSISIKNIDTETVSHYLLNEVSYTELANLFDDNELIESTFIDYGISDNELNNYLENIEVNDLFIE